MKTKAALAMRWNNWKEGDRERMRGRNVRRWKGEEDVDGWWGGGRLCVREAFNPQKHPDGSCSVQMGTEGCWNTHTHMHTHTLCVTEKKSSVECWNPFPNTLEDHAKHKVRELGCVPLFPTLLRPLELCHQLINEHNALSFSLSLSQYVIGSFFTLFHAAAQKFESLDCLEEWMCYVCVGACMQAPYELTSSQS